MRKAQLSPFIFNELQKTKRAAAKSSEPENG